MDASTLRDRLSSGDTVDLRVGDPEEEDPTQWGAERDVSADLLVELLTRPVDTGSARRVELVGARIVGVLDLRTASLTRSLLLRGCVVAEQMLLIDADALALRLLGSYVQRIDATGLHCRGEVWLSNGFTSEGGVVLSGAHIGGKFVCSGGTFRNPGGPAMAADGLFVNQSMLCRSQFTAEGEVHLVGAHIGGQLDCSGATFHNPGGTALGADNIAVNEAVFFRNGFIAEGEVRLHSARIGGQLDCSHGTFCNPGQTALNGSRLFVGHDMFLRNRFTSEGAVHLDGAQIGGVLECQSGIFRNPGRVALYADKLTVEGDMRCSEGFSTEGEVRLVSAHIRGQLDCTGGKFRNSGGFAMNLESAELQRPAFMRPAFFAGDLGLTNTRAEGGWADDPNVWADRIWFRGFTYASLYTDPELRVAKRLEWLRRDPAGYLPQPYEQLASSYRREGNDVAVRHVLIAKQWRRRANHPSRWRRWPALAWSILLRATIGYGYRPWLALWPAVTLFLTGWWLFSWDHRHELIVPRTDRPSTPTFSPARYTADLLLPVANLGERTNFMAIGAAAWHAFAFTLCGWLLALALVAGVTGIFKRE